MTVTPQFTGDEKVRSCFKVLNKLIVSFYCSSFFRGFVGNRDVNVKKLQGIGGGSTFGDKR